MKTISKVHVGVDVSKNKLDIYILEIKKHFVITNNQEGLKQLVEELFQYSVEQVVCESSGGYEVLMLQTLAKNGFKTWQVEPKRIKAFIASEGVKAKTDIIDSKMIALFASQKKASYLPLCVKFTQEEQKLNSLNKRREQLKKILITEKSRLKEHEESFCKKLLEDHIEIVAQHIKKLDKAMSDIIAKNNDLAHKSNIITSIPGIGNVTAQCILASLPEIGKLNEKEIASLIGVAPLTRQSGTYNGAAHIHGGRPAPRHVLYMASLSAIRHNTVMKGLYERLINKGKKAKVALVAVMRKIIVIMNVMIKNNTLWVTP